MILSELHGYKQYLGKSLSSAISELIDKHKINIASGMFAFVISAPSKPYVYKVWVDDRAWEAWLEYIAEHPNKHFVKRLSKIKTLKLNVKVIGKDADDIDEHARLITLKYIKLEKLKPLNTRLDSIVTDLYDSSYSTLDELLQYIADELTLSASELKKYKSFFEAYTAAVNAVTAARFDVDIHSGNVMLRGDIPVITDPASQGHDDEDLTSITASELVDIFDTEIGRA